MTSPRADSTQNDGWHYPGISRFPGKHRCSPWLVLRLLLAQICFSAAATFVSAQPLPSPPDPDAATATNPSSAEPEEVKLPKIDELPLPTVEQLLTEPPVDWIVLLNDEVHLVEPVSPRPDTLAKMKAIYDASFQWPRPIDGKQTEEQRLQRLQLQKLPITLLIDDIDPEYQIDVKYIQKIVYFEDLILQRVDQLLTDGERATCYDLLRLIERRASDWPGAAQRRQQLLSAEADVAIQQGHHERALTWLENLKAQNGAFPNLAARFGVVTDRLVQAAVEKQDYGQARHFLARLAINADREPTSKRWTERLTKETQEKIAAAKSATQQDNHRQAAELIAEAARIWPKTPELAAVYRTTVNRWQVLQVGVLDRPASSTWSVPQNDWDGAAERWRKLTQLPVFEAESFLGGRLRYRSQFIESWEPLDLGRRVDLVVRSVPAPWETRPTLYAPELSASLAAKQQTDARLREVLTSSEVTGLQSLVLHFRRPPFRPDVLLTFPLARPQVDHPEDSLSLRWQRVSEAANLKTAANVTSFVRRRPEPPDVAQRHVAEIREHRYEDSNSALQGLQRGEVDLLMAPAWSDLSQLQADARFVVGQTGIPSVHVMTFDSQSNVVANPLLRRALQLALPRQALLQQQLLAGANPSWGRLTSSVLPQQHAAYPKLLAIPADNPLLAATLVLVAKKELGKLWRPLRFSTPADPRLTTTISAIVASWKRIGIEVEILSAESAERADLSYSILRTWEPLTDFPRLLTGSTTQDFTAMAGLSETMRELLLKLEREPDWNSALRTLQRLQQTLLAEVRYLPLWEIDEFMVWRRNLAGLPNRPLFTYQGVERWTLRPALLTEAP